MSSNKFWFYTYLWLREDGTPYYAGKGRGNRAFISASHGVKRPVDRTRIVIQEFLTEEDAFEAEQFLISFYGRLDLSTGCLRNRTDGGEGISGFKNPHSQEWRDKIGAGNKGKVRTAEVIAKIKKSRVLQSTKGRKFCLQARINISRAHVKYNPPVGFLWCCNKKHFVDVAMFGTANSIRGYRWSCRSCEAEYARQRTARLALKH